MFRLIAVFLCILVLFTACSTVSVENSSVSHEAESSSASSAVEQDTDTIGSSEPESSAAESTQESEPETSPAPERTPEPDPNSDALPSWYVPYETAPDFATYFSNERYILPTEICNDLSVSPHEFYIGKNGGGIVLAYEELTDHHLYRKTGGMPVTKQLMHEGDFRGVTATEQWVYVWDTDNTCWRMPNPEGELEKVCELPADIPYLSVVAPYDNELLLICTSGNTIYAIYAPTGEIFELGPCYKRMTGLQILTNRSYCYHLATETEEESADSYYLYSGVSGKAYKVDFSKTDARFMQLEDTPLLFPLDENGTPLLGDHLQEVSLQEAGLAP